MREENLFRLAEIATACCRVCFFFLNEFADEVRYHKLIHLFIFVHLFALKSGQPAHQNNNNIK